MGSGGILRMTLFKKACHMILGILCIGPVAQSNSTTKLVNVVAYLIAYSILTRLLGPTKKSKTSSLGPSKVEGRSILNP